MKEAEALGDCPAARVLLVHATPDTARFSTTALLLNATNSLRYEMAIPVAEDEDAAGRLLWLCFLLVATFSALMGLAVWGWGEAFCRLVKAPDLAPYLWLLPLTTGAAGLFEALNFYAIRRKDFGALAQARVVAGFTQVAVQVGLGFFRLGTLGLVTGDLASRVASALRLAWGGRVTGVFRQFRWAGILGAAREFVRFPKFMAGASILNLGAIQIPFLLIPACFGAEAAGHYFLAYRTLFLPASFIGGAISQVFLGEAAARARSGEPLHQLTSRIFLILAAIYLPVFTACLAGAGLLFPVVFGARWGEAGGLAQILAPMTLVWSLARPIAGLLLVRDRLKESLAFTACELVGMATAIGLGARTGSIHRTAWYIAIYGVLISIASLWRFLRAAEADFPVVLRRAFLLLALNVPYGLLVWGAARTGGAVATLAAALAGLALVGLASYRFLRKEGLL